MRAGHERDGSASRRSRRDEGAEARGYAGGSEHWRADLRAGGDAAGGPAPFAKADRSRFLQVLDESLAKLEKELGQCPLSTPTLDMST